MSQAFCPHGVDRFRYQCSVCDPPTTKQLLAASLVLANHALHDAGVGLPSPQVTQ